MRHILRWRVRIFLLLGRNLHRLIFTVSTNTTSSCILLQTTYDFNVLANIISWIQLKSPCALSASAVAVEDQAASLAVVRWVRAVKAESLLKLVV